MPSLSIISFVVRTSFPSTFTSLFANVFSLAGLFVLTAVFLGVALLTLTGCFGKSNRRFIEGKASELSKVYPTENLEDLFEKFPDGFQIRITDTEKKDENSPTIIYQTVLNLSLIHI